jgi:hypothetical protein
MRTIVLLPLTALVAVAAGCGSGAREPAARALPQRDLTLVTQTAQVEVASPVELQQLRTHRRTVRPSQPAARPALVRRSGPLQPRVVLATLAAPVVAAAEPVAQPASPASNSINDRELLPGKTVTVIPASSGPSIDPDRTDELPAAQGRTMVARGGGTCRGRGRGPGIGIAGAPRPDFR